MKANSSPRNLRTACFPVGLERERGSALFVVLILAVVMASVFAAVISYTNQAAKIQRRSDLRLEGAYAADYAFEKAYTELKGLLTQYNLPTIAQTTGVTNLTTAPTDVFTSAAGYTWKTYLTVPTESGVVVGSYSTGFNGTEGTYRYLTMVEFQRLVPPLNNPVLASYQREFVYTIKPLFEYAIFYNDDMELFPGAAFNVSGRVHSNGTIYTGTTASISFGDWVTEVSGVVNHYSPLDPRTQGSLNGPVTYAHTPVATSVEQPPGTLVQDTSDSNHNNDGPRELIEIPRSWETDANSTERLYNKAGLKILVNTTNSAITADSGLTVPAKSGGTAGRVYATQDGTTIPASDPLATVIDGIISNATSGTMQDYREATAVTTVDVNVSTLNTDYGQGALPATIPNSTNWSNSGTLPAALRGAAIDPSIRGKALWNGILYVTDVSDSSTHATGVRVLNGSSLPDGTNSSAPTAGLTVVSNNAAYIVGDYNTGGVPPVDSGSNLAAARNVTGYTVQPAAIIADAVTVVSANWTASNYNSQSNVNSRTPTNTTINTALISGIVPTSSTAYSGGVENFIRLLENWSGYRLTYYGSMINLYASQQATAPWGNSNYYAAANRNWYFDTNFTDPTKLPPGTPSIRSIKRGQWVQLQ